MLKLLKKVLRGVCIETAKFLHLYPSRRVLILYYHSIDERVGNLYYLKTPPDIFKEQMELLKDYKVVSLGEFVRRARKGKNTEECVVITFDDGFKDNYTVAYPLLYKYDLPATFFVTTGFIGRKGYMSWKDLKELRDVGFEIGSHTVTHPRLSSLPPQKIDEELRISKEVLEEKLDMEVNLFSAPYGDSKSVNAEVFDVAAKYYDCCCLTQGYFGVNLDKLDLYRLKRTPVTPSVSEFRSTLEGYEGLWMWMYEKLIVLKNEKLKLVKI